MKSIEPGRNWICAQTTNPENRKAQTLSNVPTKNGTHKRPPTRTNKGLAGDGGRVRATIVVPLVWTDYAAYICRRLSKLVRYRMFKGRNYE